LELWRAIADAEGCVSVALSVSEGTEIADLEYDHAVRLLVYLTNRKRRGERG
jgi:hypothetical protein